MPRAHAPSTLLSLALAPWLLSGQQALLALEEKAAEKAEKKAPSVPEEPSLERLLELNQREIFGGDTTLKDGRVTVRYPGKGCFNQGFRATSSGGKGFISVLDDIKDQAMKKSVSEGMEGPFSFAAIDAGEALSKFELADDFTISFRVRLPLVPPAGGFIVRVNQQDSKNYIQTSFFQDLTVADGGKPKRKVSPEKRFAQPPFKWFLQKLAPQTATPVEIVFKEKKVTVSVTVFDEKERPWKKVPEKKAADPKVEGKKVEVVSMDGIDKPSSGKVLFKFARMSFGVADLVIDGKYSREWAEAEIARLRKEGKLRLKPEDPETVAKKDEKPRDPRSKGQQGEKRGPESEKKAPRPKKQPPNVDQPDPEAEVDL